MDISGDKESDERDQISKNYWEILTDDIEVFKLGKFSSKKGNENIEKEYDERNWMDVSDDKDSGGRYQMDKNDEEWVTNDIEVLKLVNFGSQKNRDNTEKEYDEINRMNKIDGKEFVERDQIGEIKEDDLESE